MAPAGFTPAVRGTSNPFDEIEAGLNASIFGQPRAIAAIMRTLNRAHIFLRAGDQKRPLATLMFIGPTGSGKSDIAKRLAGLLYPKGGGFLKIDCSLFSQGHEVASLIGAPPGYIGRDQKPMLNAAIIEKEYSVVLFDEIEKGARELWNLLLQIMEDGEIALSGTGTTVSFRRAIVIMTSNVGARELMQHVEGKRIGYRRDEQPAAMSGQAVYELGMKQLQRTFTPEWLNRIDEVIAFRPLDSAAMGHVFDRMLAEKNAAYTKIGYRLEVTPAARAFMLQCDDQAGYGARPIRRRIEKDIDSHVAELIGSGAIPPGSLVLLDRDGNTSPHNLAVYYQSDPVLAAEIGERRRLAKVVDVGAPVATSPGKAPEGPASQQKASGVSTSDANS